MMNRRTRWLAAMLAFLCLGVVAPSAVASGGCTGTSRVFGVDAESGHLVEILSCPESSGFGQVATVDSADWRGYAAIFGVRDGNAAIVYSVTQDGALWWRRQEAAGASLGTAVRVAPTINWNRPVVFASRPGYLNLGAHGEQIRTFHHQEWATGGATVTEAADLFGPLNGPASITGLSASFAIGVWNGVNFRVWRTRDKYGFVDTDSWYASGTFPAGVTSVVGDGVRLEAVDSAGGIVLLQQSSGTPSICPRYDQRLWEVIARAPGRYLRVIAPVADSRLAPPYVPGPPPSPYCSGPSVEEPWEWQNGGI